LAAKQPPPRRKIVRQIVDGVDDPDEVLDRMVAAGEITADQRDDVCFIVFSVIEAIWETGADGNEPRRSA